MSKVKSNFRAFFQNSISKTKSLFSEFQKFSLVTKSVIITGIILSLIGLTASVLVLGSFIFMKIEDQKEIEKVVNFETCNKFYRFKTEVVHKARESENSEFASCTGNGKEFYVKYKKTIITNTKNTKS
jgi:hypothetical protein